MMKASDRRPSDLGFVTRPHHFRSGGHFPRQSHPRDTKPNGGSRLRRRTIGPLHPDRTSPQPCADRLVEARGEVPEELHAISYRGPRQELLRLFSPVAVGRVGDGVNLAGRHSAAEVVSSR